MLRRQRVSEGICFCGRKAANLKIYLFSATKQDRVGPRLHMSFQRSIFNVFSVLRNLRTVLFSPRMIGTNIKSNIRHEDFRLLVRSSVCQARTTALKSETGCTGELWSNCVLLILKN